MARIRIGQLSKSCHRLGTSLNAGVDVLAVLQREAEHGTPAYRRNMSHVHDQVSGGMTLAEGLRDCGKYFPQLTCELVDVGEQTGRLEAVLLRLAEHYQHVLRLRRVFLMGILWPAIELTFGIVAIGLLIFFLGVLGTSVTMFGLSGTSGLAIYGGIVLALAAGLALVTFGLMRGWFGSWPGQLVVRLPVVGKAIQTMALARLSWTMSLSLDAGIDAPRAIRMALESTQNAYYTRHIDTAVARVMRGGQFHEALAGTGVFSSDFLTALQNAELSGTESESLSRMSDDYQKQAEAATTALAIAASVAIWVLVGTLFIFMIFYLFMNLYMKPINEALEMMS